MHIISAIVDTAVAGKSPAHVHTKPREQAIQYFIGQRAIHADIDALRILGYADGGQAVAVGEHLSIRLAKPQQLRLESVVFVGVSMGGRSVMALIHD